MNGDKYFLLFVDNLFPFLLNPHFDSKDQVSSFVIQYKSLIENQFNTRLKCLHFRLGQLLTSMKNEMNYSNTYMKIKHKSTEIEKDSYKEVLITSKP